MLYDFPVNVYVPKDRVTNLHQGYGFVEFCNEEDANYGFGVHRLDYMDIKNLPSDDRWGKLRGIAVLGKTERNDESLGEDREETYICNVEVVAGSKKSSTPKRREGSRKKVKLAFITNDSARKATFKKRKKGLMKKVNELSTLCGIDACAIIYSPYEAQPEVWPNNIGVQRVLAQFKRMPEMEQSKKMVNQESFTRQRITKANWQLKKQIKENREKEMTEVMYQCLTGKGSIPNLILPDLNDLGGLVDQTLKDICRRIESLKKALPGKAVAAAPPLPPRPQTTVGTNGMMTRGVSMHALEKRPMVDNLSAMDGIIKIFGPTAVMAFLVLIPVNVSGGMLFFLSKDLVIIDIDKISISNEYDVVASMRLKFLASKSRRAEQFTEAVEKDTQDEALESETNLKSYLCEAYLHPVLRSFEKIELVEVNNRAHIPSQLATELVSGSHSHEASPNVQHLKVALGIVHLVVSLGIILATDKYLNEAFDVAAIKFPSALFGMFCIFTVLVILDVTIPAAANGLMNFFEPVLLFIQRWLPLFYVPSLVVLPLAIQDIPAASGVKICLIL
ncbi:hypothetical protein L6452_25796 [Arctium lappa]|uniref:Uncharacterized protein n=2 Tax=Arctium lappa TaxID=4217 RepID=A0ACB9AAV7_ARCLA|nr:hypothetical protein L6452_25792 [Arctium lappa]KAI3707354.1 hypothetical protein L6452_25796 [Arctium lappa]